MQIIESPTGFRLRVFLTFVIKPSPDRATNYNLLNSASPLPLRSPSDTVFPVLDALLILIYENSRDVKEAKKIH